VATGMPIRNQLNVRGKKHTSNAKNCLLDAIAT
jgi:hypothetical protein